MDSPTKSKNMSFFIGIPYKLRSSKEGNKLRQPVVSTKCGEFVTYRITTAPPPSPIIKGPIGPLPVFVKLSLAGNGSLRDNTSVDIMPSEVLENVFVEAPLFSDELFEILQVFDPLMSI
jgi:hypothetical protein